MRKKTSAGSASGNPAHSRRSFIAIAGATLSAPVAAVATSSPSWLSPSGGSQDPLHARLAQLEDVDAIRALNRAFVIDVNAGAAVIGPGVVGMSHDGFGEQDVIEIAPDRETAAARIHVTVHTEAAIAPDCTVVQMARLQGGGVITGADAAVLENSYVRNDGVWKFVKSTRQPA
jgi:hypothetical protein